MITFDKILCVAPHPDDEFGCSGTLARLIREGKEVRYIVFSPCTESLPSKLEYPDCYPEAYKDYINSLYEPTHAELDVLYFENQKALDILGPIYIIRHNIHVRHFPEYRQGILEILYDINKTYKPDLVLLPSSKDMHQDHNTIYNEGRRAFKHTTVIGYEVPMNTISFANVCYLEISEDDLNKKIKSLMCYESQLHRPYINPEFIKSLAVIRGVQAGVKYAEAFEAIRIYL